MRKTVVPFVALCLVAGVAAAQTLNSTNEGGVLLLLSHPTQAYTAGVDFCDSLYWQNDICGSTATACRHLPPR